MLAAGIPVFLLVEILGEAGGQASVALRSALLGAGSGNLATLLVLLLLGGFFAGFVGLAAIEHKMIRPSAGLDPRRLSLMIAVGIGLHNLSEGLAIGQAFIQGMHGLTVGLVIGFALHNATEGFGIAGPIVRNGEQIGTHFYHAYVNDDFQMDRGMHGVFIVDPAVPGKPRYDIDALYEIGSFKVGDTDSENVFTLDGKAYRLAPVLTVPEGARVLVRLVNASAEEFHVMHLHGYTFRIMARDGNRLAKPIATNTMVLGPSQTADIAFTASNPRKWMFHCHILDHTIIPGPNGDGSATRIPAMGGLVTFIEVVRPGLVKHGYVAAGSLMRSMPMAISTPKTAG
ncbi:MAG: multicopper oxidase domain-containing protein [Acidiferrobacterales bacterium]